MNDLELNLLALTLNLLIEKEVTHKVFYSSLSEYILESIYLSKVYKG